MTYGFCTIIMYERMQGHIWLQLHTYQQTFNYLFNNLFHNTNE